jgi:uncharacterized protein (DUF2237 family)|tara:strand:- start:113 stop:475 length:363 start_codon:yes stop_codon:yes gene_type:complete
MKNVFGEPLKPCCSSPLTGYFRDGFCKTDPSDSGQHTVCAIMTDDFLAFSRKTGNDLSTPNAQYMFPGLKSGDKWCLCVLRWKEALAADCAPKVELESTNEKALEYVSITELIKYANKKL